MDTDLAQLSDAELEALRVSLLPRQDQVADEQIVGIRREQRERAWRKSPPAPGRIYVYPNPRRKAR